MVDEVAESIVGHVTSRSSVNDIENPRRFAAGVSPFSKQTSISIWTPKATNKRRRDRSLSLASTTDCSRRVLFKQFMKRGTGVASRD